MGIPRAGAHGQSPTGEADHAGFPRAMFHGLYVLSPVSGVFCHRCLPSTGRKGWTPRSRRQDHTTSPYAANVSPGERTRLTQPRPSHPCPTYRDDRETSLRGPGRWTYILIYIRCQYKFVVFQKIISAWPLQRLTEKSDQYSQVSPLFEHESVSAVMPGLVPGIHVFGAPRKADVDGRDTPGHDEVRGRSPDSIDGILSQTLQDKLSNACTEASAVARTSATVMPGR